NVAKVKEIIQYQPVTTVPNSNPAIEGIFMPRDTMITAIDLRQCIGRGTTEPGGLFIITNFNHLDIAFHVDQVIGIHRVSWSEIVKPNATVGSSDESISTGIIKIDGKLIIILDFEKIVSDINPETGLKVEEVAAIGANPERAKKAILIAEDSILLNRMIVESLNKAGYTRLIHTANGQEAYDKILEFKEAGTLKDNVQCVITDIEMPLMDGHRLTKLIKDDDVLRSIPVVIFSSLVNDEMRRKGESLGADAQLSKPEIGNLVHLIDDLLL
ncbi:MAG: chemotaxis protein, partial [Lachnospiraceae bacterium]|nr:chemotaxis protein [Lachnospiraceae bacterium]